MCIRDRLHGCHTTVVSTWHVVTLKSAIKATIISCINLLPHISVVKLFTFVYTLLNNSYTDIRMMITWLIRFIDDVILQLMNTNCGNTEATWTKSDKVIWVIRQSDWCIEIVSWFYTLLHWNLLTAILLAETVLQSVPWHVSQPLSLFSLLIFMSMV